MERPLKWEIDDSGDVLRITMSGQMTEQVVFVELLERTESRIAFDLASVRRFTSAGIREWVKFITTLSDDRTVLLERCSVAMVHQLNMIANMAGHARISSIMVPYQCPVCDNDQEEVLELEKGKKPMIARDVVCTECGEMTEFDDLSESYLSFAETHPDFVSPRATDEDD